MQRLLIKEFGPIRECEIEINDYMVFTGPQASGKSTVAKSIFFFDHLNSVLFFLSQKVYSSAKSFQVETFKDMFCRVIRENYYQAFGIDRVSENTLVRFEYDNGAQIEIGFLDGDNDGPLISIGMNKVMDDGLTKLSDYLENTDRMDEETVRGLINNDIFAFDMNVIYIPASRSLLTMLSSQINYVYAVLDDRQRRMIDYCTQCYLEEVFRVKEFFKDSPERLMNQVKKTAGYGPEIEDAGSIIGLMRDILGGEYRNTNGTERLMLDSDTSVMMNYASSGQQEAVWIVNLLFYYMLGKRKTLFIIEEPESHLFPGTQKLMTEFITIVKNGKNRVIITTHSPYILGSINNLLYANKIADEENRSDIEAIIPSDRWIDYESMGAYFLSDGLVKNICDDEFEDIDHDVIDGVSGVINDDYDKMLNIYWRDKE